MGGNLLFKCNFKTQRLPARFTDFFTECLEAWSEETELQNEGKNQIVWNNKNILLGGKSVYFREFASKGILRISDLFERDIAKPWPIIEGAHFSLLHKLKWIGLISAIPSDIKQNENGVNDIHILINGTPKPLEGLSRHTIKNELTSRVFTAPASQAKLEEDLNSGTLDWKKMYKLMLKMTIDSKTREFQFKILHNILYTNEKLHKLNPQKFPTPLCTFCMNEGESYEHLFYACSYSVSLWRNLLLYWGDSLELSSPPSKLCLIISDPSESLLVNFISLLVRKHTYYCKMNGAKPSFAGLVSFIRRIYQIESFIAKKNNKMTVHLKKWSPILFFVR